jgi:hypothetical protein
MHACISLFFYFFTFLVFFLGWVQLSPHGLCWTQPARPGHWPKPVTGQIYHARLYNHHLIKSLMHSIDELFYRARDTCLGAE